MALPAIGAPFKGQYRKILCIGIISSEKGENGEMRGRACLLLTPVYTIKGKRMAV